MKNIDIYDVNMSCSVLGDANMDKIEICHVSLGEAHIHDTNLGFQGKKVPLKIEEDINMKKRLLQSHSVFPAQDIISTSEYRLHENEVYSV